MAHVFGYYDTLPSNSQELSEEQISARIAVMEAKLDAILPWRLLPRPMALHPYCYPELVQEHIAMVNNFQGPRFHPSHSYNSSWNNHPNFGWGSHQQGPPYQQPVYQEEPPLPPKLSLEDQLSIFIKPTEQATQKIKAALSQKLEHGVGPLGQKINVQEENRFHNPRGHELYNDPYLSEREAEIDVVFEDSPLEVQENHFNEEIIMEDDIEFDLEAENWEDIQCPLDQGIENMVLPPTPLLPFSEKQQNTTQVMNQFEPAQQKLEPEIVMEGLMHETEDKSLNCSISPDAGSPREAGNSVLSLNCSIILHAQRNHEAPKCSTSYPRKRKKKKKLFYGIKKTTFGESVILKINRRPRQKDLLRSRFQLFLVKLKTNMDEIAELKFSERNPRLKSFLESPYDCSDDITTWKDTITFNDDPGSQKKILPQYDDPAQDEGLILDERGRFTGEAEKKLEELRRRIQGVPMNNHFEDLNMSGKPTSDFYTHEEMLQFKKPKKKKSLRRKEKLDLDALEAEAVATGLGVSDLGSRNDARRQAIKEEQERLEAERRSSAYLLAYAKADEASKSLRLEQTLPVKPEEDERILAEDDDDLYKSLERARKLALKKKEEETASGPQEIALLATTAACSQTADDQIPSIGESQENRVVFTEMEEFVWGLQLDEESHKPESEDEFMQEDEEPKAPHEERTNELGGWTEVKDIDEDKKPDTEDKEKTVPNETIRVVAVGKGLSSVLKLLKDRGTLKEGIEWGGRNMDKKKSKLLGIVDDDDEPKETNTARKRKAERKDTRPSSSGHQKEMRPPKVYQEKDIHIERTDEFGRTLTPKEDFRILSHKFHGKGPGKMKQEKRMKQYQEELKLKQMKSSDTPSLSAERMRDTQARLQTPYIVLSGHVKPGQTSDPQSGFATVEKALPGDRKVEHFLGIKRKAEPEEGSGTPMKPKT